MAARSQGRRYDNRRRTGVYESGYIQGNTVRKAEVYRRPEAEPRRRTSPVVKKNQEKARHMNPGYVLFLVLALAVAGFVLIGYIRLQSDITSSITRISHLESQLNDMRLSNDEEYSRIESSVDLDEVRRIAIEELGMTYASEGQVITYSADGSDYVRQVQEIPD